MRRRLLLAAVFVLVLLGFDSVNSQTWVSGYNGSANGDDQVTAVCPDENGNVYVTGFSVGANTGYDIVTIKYNGNGTQVWAVRYPGQGSGEDKAFGIAMDNDGYIYVTGYATPSTANKEDMILIKYNTSGDQIWAVTYNSGSGNSDRAFGIAIDNNEDGDQNQNNIYITGHSQIGNNYNYRTVKIRSDGILEWSRSYDAGSNLTDQAWGIVVDDNDFVIVTGYSQSTANSFDYYTIKYSEDGTVVWARRYNGPSNSDDRAFGVVVDSENNYVITGYTSNNISGNPATRDITTIQYDKSGSTKWTKIYNSPDDLEDNSFGIAIDELDNIYVIGTTERSATSKDFITIKYSPTGGQSWLAAYNNGLNNSDAAYDVAISPSGSSVYVVGSSVNGLTEYPLMVKYTSSGVLQQSALYSSQGRAVSVSVSNANNLFVGGYNLVNSDNSVLNNDFITMEFEGGIISVIGISGNSNEIPKEYKLGQNYPNPFNPVTNVKIQMPNSGNAKLIVHDITGKEISVLVNHHLEAGIYEVSFDAGNLASGIYFYKLVVTDGASSFNTSFTDTKKMVLVK